VTGLYNGFCDFQASWLYQSSQLMTKLYRAELQTRIRAQKLKEAANAAEQEDSKLKHD